MRKIITFFIVVFTFTTINAQQIKDLKYFYTDNINFNPSDLDLNRVYYKDTNNYFTPFLGQWKSTIGSQTLLVTLWKETKKPTFWGHEDPVFYRDEIFGHYQIFQDYGLQTQTELYKSQINIGNTTQIWDTVVIADAIKSNKLSGMIHDVNATPLNPVKYPQGLTGFLSMNINSGTSPLTAQWKIVRSIGFTRGIQPINFIIPTDVTLTKI
jgi:hypothetical protein